MHPYPAEKSRIGCLVMTRKLALNLGTKDSNPSAEEYGRLEMLYTLMPVVLGRNWNWSSYWGR